MDVFWEVIQVPPSSSHSLPPSHRAVMSSMVVTRHMWSVRGGWLHFRLPEVTLDGAQAEGTAATRVSSSPSEA